MRSVDVDCNLKWGHEYRALFGVPSIDHRHTLLVFSATRFA